MTDDIPAASKVHGKEHARSMHFALCGYSYSTLCISQLTIEIYQRS